MASVHDVKLDIRKTPEKTIGKISLKLVFSKDEMDLKQKYGLYTALISEDTNDDEVIRSPYCLHYDDHDNGNMEDESAMSWIDTRMIKANKNKVVHLDIEKMIGPDSRHSSDIDYRAVVYLIPEQKTVCAWSGNQKKRVV